MRKLFIISALTLVAATIGTLSFVNSKTSNATGLDQIGLANLQALTTGENNPQKEGFSRFPGKCLVSDNIAFILSGTEEYRNKINYGCLSGAIVDDAQFICTEEGPLRTCTPFTCNQFIESIINSQ